MQSIRGNKLRSFERGYGYPWRHGRWLGHPIHQRANPHATVSFCAQVYFIHLAGRKASRLEFRPCVSSLGEENQEEYSEASSMPVQPTGFPFRSFVFPLADRGEFQSTVYPNCFASLPFTARRLMFDS